jgi:hypothetical protein
MTHKQRVLQLLADNQPHSHLEGYRLGVMLHSRVADLRKDGYTIKCWAENGLYLYQLFGTVREGGDAADGLAALSARSHGQPLDAVPPLASQTPESAEVGSPGGPQDSSLPFDLGGHQLTVWEAA